MKRWKKWLMTAGMMAMALGVTGCGSGKSGKTEVNIGYFNNITHAQALLMKAEQTLEERLGEEAEVSWTAFNAGPAEVEALFAGSIDIGYIGPVPATSANVKSNGDVKVLAGATQGGAVLIKRKDSGIEEIADLAGKTVAIPQIGNTQHLCLLDLLEEKGLRPVSEGGDVTITAVANADVANMMERGDIDAAFVPEPWGATLLGQGAELLLDYDEVYMNGEYDVAVVVVRNEFMEEHPEIVDAFMAEHEAATLKITEDKENALKTMNTELENATGKALSEEILNAAFERIGISTKLNKDALIRFGEISKEQGFIGEIPEEGNLFAE